MSGLKAIARLLKDLVDRLETCIQCQACLDGITSAMESVYEEALKLGIALTEDTNLPRKRLTAAAILVTLSLVAEQPWEKIHV
jgi:polyferredoxin